ncbi:hypothetical protein [Candidatus Mesenet endosymbiont of Agriotes lineatus]|uniref:hypothetical protein n=1 Tax=Candidatus Mesenet endosymbiont of Agriotes lineatus TaxID=3077948 RepID=UPI0030D482F6
MLEYKSGTKISKDVVDALVEKLSNSQFFNLILAQFKCIKVCNRSTDNLILVVKAIPKTSELSNDTRLYTADKFKKQMLEQLCIHMQPGEDYSFPHAELCNNSCLLRIFVMQTKKGEELCQTTLEDYEGFISSKGLLPTILNYNKLEIDSLYAVSKSKCFELIRMEKEYGYTFYQTESSDHFTMLVSTKKLPKGVHRYNAPQFINDAKFLLNSATDRKAAATFKTNSMADVKSKLDIARILDCIFYSTLTLEEDLDVLRNVHSLVASNTYKIDLHDLLNLFLPLVSSIRMYKEQIYSFSEGWVNYRALPNIEEVSINADEIIERGKKIYVGNKELIKYKHKMYEYQEVPCLGKEKIELLMYNGLFVPYIEPLPNLYLQSIDLSNQEYCKRQKALAKQFIESGNGFFISRRGLISMFSKVLKVVFPSSGLDIRTIGVLFYYNQILPYVKIVSSFSTKPDHLKAGYCLSLKSKATVIMASLNKFIILYKKIEDFAIDLCGEEMATKLKENNNALGFLNALSESVVKSSPYSCLRYLGHMGSVDGAFDDVEKVEHAIECYQKSLNNLLLSVNINEETVQRFTDEDFKMIIKLYCDLESNNEVRAEVIKDIKQYSGDLFLTQNTFQNSCHEMIHQIFCQIGKQSKKEQSVNSELTDSSISVLSKKASKLNVIR